MNQNQPGRLIAIEQRSADRDTSRWIDDHRNRAVTRTVTNGQGRLICSRRPGAHYNGIDQRAQAMQVGPHGLIIDVIGITRGRGDSSVQTLSELGQRQSRALEQRGKQRHGGLIFSAPAPDQHRRTIRLSGKACVSRI